MREKGGIRVLPQTQKPELVSRHVPRALELNTADAFG